MNFLLNALPLLLFSLILCVIGCMLYFKQVKKKQSAINASVVGLVRHGKHNYDGYLIKETYDITIEYLKDGIIKKDTIRNHMFAYNPGDQILIVVDDAHIEILTQTNNCFYSHNIVHPKWYKIFIIVSVLIAMLSFASVLPNEGKSGFLTAIVFTGLLTCVLQLFVVKMKNKTNILINKSYDTVIATIIDIRRDSKRTTVAHSQTNTPSNTSVKYFYNVSYEWNNRYFFCNLPKQESSNINMIGRNIKLKVDKYTGEYINEITYSKQIVFLRFFQTFTFLLLVMSIMQYFLL